MMRRVVINRKCEIGRLEAFNIANAHVSDIERSIATEGGDIELSHLAERGIAEAGLTYTPGALGAALSHLALWGRAVRQNEALTIFEDDVKLCCNFGSESDRLISSLAPDWDILLFGYNFNGPITIDALPGLGRSVITFEEARMQQTANAFRTARPKSGLYRLLQGFGLCAYAISPSGARRLLECCLPLRAQEYQQLGLDRMVRNVGLDVVTSFHYGSLNAFAAFPPLAITPNDKATSSTRSMKNL